MGFLRMDLSCGEIFVFAPDRNVQALPNGSNPDRHRVLRAHGALTAGLPIASVDPRSSSRSPLTALPRRQKVSFDDRSD